ncbi:MAG: hypothetical protein FJX76_02675 [Armatimonadetes bacterium]|nr:hypothetical protein [Armatimonadota bacterium]
MAQQNNQPVQAVGAAQARNADAATDARQADAARNQNKADGGKQGEAPPDKDGPAFDLTQLSPDAQRQIDEENARKQQAEQDRLQAEMDAKLAEIEKTKQEIQQAKDSGDQAKVDQLTQKLHQQEAELGAIFDRPVITNAARDTATQAPTLDFMPRPAGGAPMGGQGVPNFGQMGGMPGMGGPPAGVTGRPAANPNVQIPDFGPKASKAEIGQMLDAASNKYGIPPNILKAVAWQESGWNQNALSFDGQHGKGVMQIDDRFHEFARTKDVFDPKKNIDYGAKYLSSLYEKTGSWEMALKRYNGGSSYPPKVLALAERQPWNAHV